MAQREKPALQAVYNIPYGKVPRIERATRNTRVRKTLTVIPDGDNEEFEHDHSESVIELLDRLGIRYKVDVEESVETGTDQEIDPGFTKAARELAALMAGEQGNCTADYYGGIIVETFAEFGESTHKQRRLRVESFYASRGLPPGDWTLECRHIFSAQVCKPLAIKTTIEVEGEDYGSSDGMPPLDPEQVLASIPTRDEVVPDGQAN